MPNPQLTGAGLGGLGFLETHHFMEFHGISSTDPGKRVVGLFHVVSLYKDIKGRKKKGNKS